MFTLSLYLAALLSSLVASMVIKKLGRKLSMLFGGILFFAGALINGFAQKVWMLIVGRILLGFGIGFANQVTHPFKILHCFVLDQEIRMFKDSFWFWCFVKTDQSLLPLEFIWFFQDFYSLFVCHVLVMYIYFFIF